LVYKLVAAFRKQQPEGRDGPRHRAKRPMIPTVSLLNVAVLVAGILLWNGLATHTVGGLGSILTQAVESLRGGTDNGKSSDVSYSLFGGGAPAPAQILSQYVQTTLTQTGTAAQRAAAGFYPAATLSKFPLTTSYPLQNLPLTPLGNLLGNTGLNATTLNSVMRAGVARLLQLFVVIGLISAVRRARKRQSGWMAELIALATGALIIVALQVVLPAISADYGVLRAFQQALIAFGPLVAVGSLAIFRFLPEEWSLRAAFAVAIVFFASLVGIIPQALGGYPAQLNLNNSGQYYDIYYTHPQDITAIQWLQSHIPNGTPGGPPQPQVQIDPFVYSELQTYSTLNLNNIDFPSLLLKNSYLFLGYQTVTEHQATLFTGGDLITYSYPMNLLNSTDNLVYSSNGAMIYG